MYHLRGLRGRVPRHDRICEQGDRSTKGPGFDRGPLPAGVDAGLQVSGNEQQSLGIRKRFPGGLGGGFGDQVVGQGESHGISLFCGLQRQFRQPGKENLIRRGGLSESGGGGFFHFGK